jgi:hypothetical protein
MKNLFKNFGKRDFLLFSLFALLIISISFWNNYALKNRIFNLEKEKADLSALVDIKNKIAESDNSDISKILKTLKGNHLADYYEVINGKIIVAGPYRVAEFDENNLTFKTLLQAKPGEVFGLVDVYGGNVFESSVYHLIEYKYDPDSQTDLKQIQVIVYSVDDNKRPEGECDPETTCPKILYKKVIDIK